MSDEWNLKDRLVIDKQVSPFEYWYAKSSVDILRQKLIEDVSTKGIICSHYMTRDDFIAIIDKRFGVE